MNTPAVNRNRTHEGGMAAPAQSPLMELQRAVASCLLFEDTFYESGSDIAERLSAIASHCDAHDVCRIAIDARKNLGLRHVALWLALGLTRRRSTHPAGNAYGRTAVNACIQRADELAEILAMYWRDGRKPLPSALKRGIADAFPRFSAYSLAKYNRDQAVKLRDVLFLTHPKPNNAAQVATWKQLVDGTLPTPDTWEVALSAGGNKRETWERLLDEGKLGGLALLRNLRNMLAAGVPVQRMREGMAATGFSHVEETGLPAKAARTPRELFRGVQPWQFLSAATEAPAMAPYVEPLMLAMAGEGPMLHGMTYLVVDVSPSMDDPLSGKGKRMRKDAAACLAVHLRERCQMLRVFTFSSGFVEVPPYRGLGLVAAIDKSQEHNGTFLRRAILELAKKTGTEEAARVIIITDEQSADGGPPQLLDTRGYLVNVAPYKPALGVDGCWTRIHGWSDRLVEWLVLEEKLAGPESMGMMG